MIQPPSSLKGASPGACTAPSSQSSVRSTARNRPSDCIARTYDIAVKAGGNWRPADQGEGVGTQVNVKRRGETGVEEGLTCSTDNLSR